MPEDYNGNIQHGKLYFFRLSLFVSCIHICVLQLFMRFRSA